MAGTTEELRKSYLVREGGMRAQEPGGWLGSKLVFLSIYSLSRGVLKSPCVKSLMLQSTEKKRKVRLPVTCAPTQCRGAGAKHTFSAFQIGPGLSNSHKPPRSRSHFVRDSPWSWSQSATVWREVHTTTQRHQLPPKAPWWCDAAPTGHRLAETPAENNPREGDQQ